MTSDYYPFGMLMEDTTNWRQDTSYRFGFNGYEMDYRVRSYGNSVEFGGRNIYDPRLARFVSVDPKFKSLVTFAPYSFAINNPILFIDGEGKGPIVFRFKTFLSSDAYYFTGLLAGIGDGLIESVDMALGVAQAKQAYDPLTFFFYTSEAQALRADHYELGLIVLKLTNDAELRETVINTVKSQIGDWFGDVTFEGTDAEAGYAHGKLVFDGLAAVIGVSEIKYLLKTGRFSTNALKLIAKQKVLSLAKLGAMVGGSKKFKVIARYGNRKNIHKHLKKRQNQCYKFEIVEEMEAYGKEFFERTGDNIIDYVDKDGVVYRVDTKTNEIGFLNADGTIQSVYKRESKSGEKKDVLEYLKDMIAEDKKKVGNE